MKRNLFQKATFAIDEDSFRKQDVKEGELEGMKRLIVENGGVVVNMKDGAHYLVQEDGSNNNIWAKAFDGNDIMDEKNRKIIHFRWVIECINQNHLLNQTNAVHLCPLPQRVPIASFQDLAIEFTLFPEVDKYVFNKIAELYGFKITFKE